ncbi:MAG: SAM-dependent methyltransferase, partial [Planctomycetaceae bacterium]
PNLRFAYSRPGFVTFKQADDSPFPDDFQTRSVFARVLGVSLGKSLSEDPAELVAVFWRHLEGRTVEGLHVFPRDRSEPGHRGYEPGLTPESMAAEQQLRSAETCPPGLRLLPGQPGVAIRQPDPLNGPLIADAILVEPQEWWVGLHRARRPISGWPGGFFPAVERPERIVSRVFFKMHESLVWAGFPLQPGQTVAEIGCSPGGASQVLLAAGLKVVGIDPAVVDPLIAAHPNFRHIRKRSKDVSRREFQGVDWLTCDINLPPSYTLDTVESIITHPKVRIRGLILTLKLIEWALAEEIPQFVERVRGWGYSQVRVRQLHHNRQEVCLVAR